MKDCPVCGSEEIAATVRRDRLPIFQNVVWDSREEALAAPSAPFILGTCADCGFSFNAEFQPDLVVYDERYDNDVPSPAFRKYYQSLVDMLSERYDLSSGTVYDVGCGKGEFLEMLCASAPGVKGVGIDPSCTEVERDNFKLIRAFLEPSHFAADTRLVVVRHVLEHIHEPVEFMKMIRGCVPGVPVYVEVPDLAWILENDAFWDFCYEHCNYFTQPALAACLKASGFAITEQQNSFGDQYQWAICQPSEVALPPVKAGESAVFEARDYVARENLKIAELSNLAQAGGGVAVWGMATKGVMLSAILGAGAVVGGIDGNPKKQGKFAAASGVAIHPPTWTQGLPSGLPTLIMNPNYAAEIAETVGSIGAKVALMPV